ncbi:hypothetical protein EHSB41UT_04805 [Parendozoicomonas haliclonae]|uniref:Uncharacterized protein n=1 Tax=Parendozoicomonas haliclonae TaxID=1960125 RepID=A0A1X7AS61_9GAMM|nr:hypothetical protein EHSB41UT_04805 [Parendozoicomonas haliclonae]
MKTQILILIISSLFVTLGVSQDNNSYIYIGLFSLIFSSDIIRPSYNSTKSRTTYTLNVVALSTQITLCSLVMYYNVVNDKAVGFIFALFILIGSLIDLIKKAKTFSTKHT